MENYSNNHQTSSVLVPRFILNMLCLHTFMYLYLCQSTARSDLALFNAIGAHLGEGPFSFGILGCVSPPHNGARRGNSQLNVLKGDPQRPMRERLQVWNGCIFFYFLFPWDREGEIECCKCMAAFKFATIPPLPNPQPRPPGQTLQSEPSQQLLVMFWRRPLKCNFLFSCSICVLCFFYSPLFCPSLSEESAWRFRWCRQ